MVRRAQRGVDRALHGPAGRPLVDELHLGFGGVDVDVDRRWIELDVDHPSGCRPPGGGSGRPPPGRSERAVLHQRPLTKKNISWRWDARQLGRADPAADRDPRHGRPTRRAVQRDRRRPTPRPRRRRRGDGVAGAAVTRSPAAVDRSATSGCRCGGTHRRRRRAGCSRSRSPAGAGTCGGPGHCRRDRGR